MTLGSLGWPTGTTLWERWRRHAAAAPQREAIAFVRAGEPTRRWLWGDLIERAERYAAWLVAAGVAPGDTCALVSRHHPEFYPVYLGICAAGAVPAVLAYPNARLHPDKFREGLTGMAQTSGLDWLLCERDLEGVVAAVLATPGSTVRHLLFPYEAVLDASSPPVVLPDKGGETPALLQHSSGTTGLQKAVVLSHRAILEHVSRYGRAIEVTGEDRIVSWLPLYHDMGLIAAFHLPLALGIPTVQLDPFEWIMAPILLMEVLAAERGTLCWLPNFAYSLMGARLHDDELEGLSLGHVRMLINCSEPVRQESHDLFAARLARTGLRRESLAASYAMAEATFAVTQTHPSQGSRQLGVSASALAQGVARAAAAGEPVRTCVSSGSPISGCTLAVVDEGGAVLPEGRVGEIVVRSVSLFDGYRNQPGRTAEVLSDGWYYTGDLGFSLDGEWYVVGRKKDVIIVAGKNLYPEDLEAAVAGVSGAVAGRVVAFGRYDRSLGTERVCVVLETDLDPGEHARLRERVVEAVQRIDVTVSEVYCVPLRWLIKSSSGKPSRAANRERVLDELTERGQDE